MFRVCGVKAELFMEFADRRLLRGFVPLELATWEGDLPAVTAALCPLDQQHLTVERVRINALTTPRWAAAPQRHRGHKERGYHRNARIATRGRIEVDRLKTRKAKRGECLWKRKGEFGETPRRIATERLLNTVCESVDQRDRSAWPARCVVRTDRDPWRTRRAVARWERLWLAPQGMLEHLADRLHRNDLQ